MPRFIAALVLLVSPSFSQPVAAEGIVVSKPGNASEIIAHVSEPIQMPVPVYAPTPEQRAQDEKEIQRLTQARWNVYRQQQAQYYRAYRLQQQRRIADALESINYSLYYGGDCSSCYDNAPIGWHGYGRAYLGYGYGY